MEPVDDGIGTASNAQGGLVDDPPPIMSRLPQDVLARFADDIEAVHAINPNAWALNVIHSGGLCLFVEAITVLYADGSEGGLSLVGKPDDPQYAGLDRERVVDRYQYLDALWYKATSSDELLDLLDRFGHEHRQVLELLAPTVKTHTQRATSHSIGLVDAISKLVERSLPQPIYVEGLGVAVNAPPPDRLPLLMDIFDPSPQAARQMARTIQAAHGISPDSWAVFPTNKRIALMVGNVVAGGSNAPGKYDFVVLRSRLDTSTERELNGQQVPKIPKNYPSLSFPRLPDDTSDEGFALLEPAHRDALEVVTNPYKKAILWQEHKTALKHRIETISGIELPEPGYLPDIPNEPVQPKGKAPLPPRFALESIRNHFAASGLHYTEVQVATFYTALQTKGFVVLSGISGTGKSKIATGLVEMLPDLAETGPVMSPDDDPLVAQVKPGMHKHHWIQFFGQKRDRFPRPHERRSVNVAIHLGDTVGTGLLRYDGDVGPKAITINMHQPLHKAMEALPLGKSLIVNLGFNDIHDEISTIWISPRHDVREAPTQPASNHLFLSVRPDWRDSTSLLGYYNPLTETYEWTDFLKFIIRAGENYRGPEADRIAWFVILDEMNLAHVEYYFADMLSVLESGRHESGKDKGWTKEAVRLTYPDTIDDEAPPRELKLPPNLYVIGTVNMDETTHAFSPKVLDRAFTIELTDVDFLGYQITGGGGDAAALTDDEKQALLTRFSRNGRFIRIDKDEIAETVDAHPQIRAHLQSLNELLRRDRFHFGYRVFDEIGQYLACNDWNGMMSFVEAFDQAVFMKVLPKFTGSRSRLRSPLLSVLAWAIEPESPDVTGVTKRFEAKAANPDTAPTVLAEGEAYPVTARRVLQMLDTLETDGFVSFG